MDSLRWQDNKMSMTSDNVLILFSFHRFFPLKKMFAFSVSSIEWEIKHK